MVQETHTVLLYQPRGVGGKGDGREGQKVGDICIPLVNKTTKICKAIILQLKNK